MLLEILIDGNDGFQGQIFDGDDGQRLGRVDEEGVRRRRRVAFRFDDDQKPSTLEPVTNETSVGQNYRHLIAVA